MSTAVSTMQELPVPAIASESMDHTSSYSSLMNGFGLWSTTPAVEDVKKSSGSDAGTADADEEMGEEYIYEEPVVTEITEDASLKKKKKLGSFLKKLKTRSSAAKKERQEKRIQKLEEKRMSSDSKSCLPTLSLPARRAYPVQITILEHDAHDDLEIDDLDEEEEARETIVKAQGQKIKNLEWLTDQRIKDAMANDDTESICSMDGIPILPPPEDAKTSNKKKKQQAALAALNRKRDPTKIQPQFIQATKGQSALEAVRREVDALMEQQAAAEELASATPASKSRAIPEAAPVEEQASPVNEEVTPPSTPTKGWALFSSKNKDQPKVAQQETEEEKDVEDAEAPATPESKMETSPSKKSSGWSMFSWKSKDGADESGAANKYDEDECYDDDYVEDESYEGSGGSYDDDYTRGAPSMVSEDETRSRPTRITVVDYSKKDE